jgi:hypothetical protein
LHVRRFTSFFSLELREPHASERAWQAVVAALAQLQVIGNEIRDSGGITTTSGPRLAWLSADRSRPSSQHFEQGNASERTPSGQPDVSSEDRVLRPTREKIRHSGNKLYSCDSRYTCRRIPRRIQTGNACNCDRESQIEIHKG